MSIRADGLNEDSGAILDELVKYHSNRLHEFERRLQRNRSATNRKYPVYLSRAISQMAAQGLKGTPEAEFFQEMARIRGVAFDPQRVNLPWEFFRRDLNASNALQGGYLLGLSNTAAQDILRPWSVVISGGVTVEENLSGNVTIPKTTATSTIYWQNAETTEATASNPTIQQAAMTAKVAIGVINCSRNFMIQADPERWLQRELKRTAASAIDQAVLSGSGINGQPLGLTNTSGLSSQSGASLAWSGALTMKKLAAEADAQDGSISFITTPAVRALLEAREKASGNGGFIWQDDEIAGCPSFATTQMPAATMLSGPMSGITLGLWGNGLQVEVNPYSSFKTGGIAVRVLLAVDLAITVDLTSFTLASSIT